MYTNGQTTAIIKKGDVDMPMGSVNYSNNAVNFGRKPHVSSETKRTAAYVAAGVATGAAVAAGVVYRKNIGSMFSKIADKFATFFKQKTGKMKGLPAPGDVKPSVTQAMQGTVDKVKVKQGFKGFMYRVGNGIKKGFNKVVDFFKTLGGKIKNIFKSNKKNLPSTQVK